MTQNCPATPGAGHSCSSPRPAPITPRTEPPEVAFPESLGGFGSIPWTFLSLTSPGPLTHSHIQLFTR